MCGGEDGFGFGLGEGVVVSFVFGGFDEELELGDLLAFHIEDDIAEGEEVLEV